MNIPSGRPYTIDIFTRIPIHALFFTTTSSHRKSTKEMTNRKIRVGRPVSAAPKQNEEKSAKYVFFEKRRAQRLGLLVELLHFMSYIKKEKAK